MKRVVISIPGPLLICVLSCVSLWAQATAQISGTVRDQSGAVLPGVEVTATQTDTGIARSAISNETGSYVLSNLALGPYKLEASLPGFRTFVQTGIVLQVNANPVINPTLEVGQVSEQVEVQANAALVETRSQGVGSIMENQRILELPLNGRQVTDLIELSGAATPAAQFGQAPRNLQRTNPVSIAGGLSTGISFFLDGANHSHMTTGGNLSAPFPDALQEFKVETSALSAQSGMHSAGVVTMVTKSGTNGWHGDLFEFVRNGKFNARNAFALKRDTLKRNQFGGTVGGPVKANKLFFFAGYQGTTTRSDPGATTSFVPTPAMLAGDFTTISSPACNSGRQITLRAPFVNNRIDPAQFSKVAVNIVNHPNFPQPVDACGRVIWGIPTIVNDHMAVGRVDYQWTNKHTLFGRYLADSSRGPNPYQLTQNLLTGGALGPNGLAQSFTLGSTYLINANVVNALRLTANRTATNNDGGQFISWSDMGANIYTPAPHMMVLTVTGAFAIGSASQGGPAIGNYLGGSDDVSWVRGTHQIAFGGAAGQFTNNDYNKGRDTGRANVNGSITGSAMADFMTGNIAAFDQGGSNRRQEYKWYLGLYGTDAWKATRKLTVNYGVRWEPYFAQVFKNGDSLNFNLDAFLKGQASTVYKGTPAGLFFTGDPGIPGAASMFTKWANISPRLGLAWDVHGDGSTSIRASYGLYYDFLPLVYYTGRTPAFLQFLNLSGVKMDNPWANYPGGNPFPIARPARGQEGKLLPRQIIPSIPVNAQPPQVSQWNLSIQKQLGQNWLASASYIGSNIAHLWSIKALNPSIFLGLGPCTLNGVSYTVCSTTANTDQRRLLSLLNPTAGEYFANVNEIDQGGTASYNGLLLSIQRRATRGVTLSSNYTWSHCIGDANFVQFNTTATAEYTDPLNRRADRGACSTTAQDRRHLFNVTAVADTPNFSNHTLHMLATGWKFSPLIRISSGPAVTVTNGTDVALNGIDGQRPNRTAENPYINDGGLRYLNPAAWAVPQAGTLGNSGVGTVVAPAVTQFDASLSRSFQISERQRVEVRAEAFNLLNNSRKGNLVTSLNSATFGQITSALDPRIMQFALKYVF